MMKKAIVIFMIAAMFASCGDDGPKKVELKEGEKIINTFTNGTPQIVREMVEKDGKLEAVYEKEYYEDGNLLKEGPIINNQRDGLWKSYYRSGKLWSEGYYEGGTRNDSIKGYYTNGQLKYVGIFDHGQKTDTWIYYDENGKLIENKVYMKPGEKREADIYIPE